MRAAWAKQGSDDNEQRAAALLSLRRTGTPPSSAGLRLPFGALDRIPAAAIGEGKPLPAVPLVR
jgi:hypothetical protein